MSCESNPEVISTPMQQAKRQKYMVRRFGFLYHLIGSSAAICVTMGSETPWTWEVNSSIGICGAIVKSQAHANSQLENQLVEFRSPDFATIVKMKMQENRKSKNEHSYHNGLACHYVGLKILRTPHCIQPGVYSLQFSAARFGTAG